MELIIVRLILLSDGGGLVDGIVQLKVQVVEEVVAAAGREDTRRAGLDVLV